MLSLLGELLVGSVEEVTPVVRGGTYRALLIIVKHHAVDLLANDCTIVVELVQRGVSDKDRSSRLLAGYVLIGSWSFDGRTHVSPVKLSPNSSKYVQTTQEVGCR